MQVITGPGRSQSVMLAGSGTLTVAAVRFIQCPCPEATLYREQAHARAVAARQRDAQQVRESSNAISAMMDATTTSSATPNYGADEPPRSSRPGAV